MIGPDAEQYFPAAGVFADEAEPVGRDVAREGSLTDVVGTLRYQDNEWYLDARGSTYELHMGIFGHEDGLPFSDGATAEVYGFVMPSHIAPIRVVSGGQAVEFWHADRYPLWAGSGERRNAVDPDTGVRANTAEDAGRGLGASGNTDDTFERGFRNQDLRPGQGR